MEVALSANLESRLAELAIETGLGTDDLVREAVSELIARRTRLNEQVQVGIDQIERGEFIEEEEMDARVDRMLNS